MLSRVLSETVFNSMYQVMRQGWNRAQLEQFLASLPASSNDDAYTLSLYRSDLVGTLFGQRNQAPADSLIRQALHDKSVAFAEEEAQILRYAYPLIARSECQRCHTNARVGDVLGVIEVSRDIAPLMASAQGRLLLTLLLIAPLPVLLAVAMALLINRKIKRSVVELEGRIDRVNSVADLTGVKLKSIKLGFREFDRIFQKLQGVVDRLRTVAVDKELLEFNTRLTEKVVITSDVLKNWKQYLAMMLRDINSQIPVYSLFSLFKLEGQGVRVEVFWLHEPIGDTRQVMEQAILAKLRSHAEFSQLPEIRFHHEVADVSGSTINLSADEVVLQMKTLQLEQAGISGVLGMSCFTVELHDPTRMLVIEHILSILLNMAGSVTAIGKYTEDLEHYATRDSLTGLFNQRMFRELLKHEIARGDRHCHRFSLLVIDVDNFKSINDSYGHRFGDRFLKQIADQIAKALRQGDILARYGGDEFVVILPDTEMEQARLVCQRILRHLTQFTLTAPVGSLVKGTVSIGGASYPVHATSCNDLFMFADNMMYKSKDRGKNRYCLPAAGERFKLYRNKGEHSLMVSRAIDEGRLIPYFQPIMAAASGKIAAVEVLSRIQLKSGRLLGAHEFIETAERAGLIQQLDYQVMEKAFAKVREAGYGGLLFINLSPKAMVSKGFIPTVRSLVKRYAMDPARVVLEITERETIDEIASLQAFVHQLKEQGFKLAIDDFGSGFSSFHYLKHLPIDFVKIEGEFVANMHSSPKDAAFVHSIAALAQQLGIPTVAEFVETDEILDAVRAAGITLAQGYHIARPGPELPVDALLGSDTVAGLLTKSAVVE